LSDNNKILIAGNYPKILSLNLNENNSSRVFYEAWNTPLAIALAPDSQKLAVASFGEAKILNVSDSTVIIELESAPPSSLVLRLDYSPDGSHLSGADANGGIIIWDTNSGDLVQTLQIPLDTCTRVENVTYSPDGRLLAVKCRENVKVFESKNGSLLANLESSPDDMWLGASSMWISFTPDNRYLIYCAYDNSITTLQVVLVDTTTWEIAQSFPGYSLHAISPDGKWLALGIEEPTTPEEQHILLIELASGESRTLPSFTAQPVYMAFAPNNQTMIELSKEGYVYFYDISKVRQ
jgi:WD40 repeat protein